MKKTIVACVLCLLSVATIAGEANNKLEASANVENICLVTAGDINFGVVNSPLTAQSANSQMRILCTKNATYTIDLKYGANTAGSGASTSGTYTFTTPTIKNDNHYDYKIYKDGLAISDKNVDIHCIVSNGNFGVFFETKSSLDLYKNVGDYSMNFNIDPSGKVCSNNNGKISLNLTTFYSLSSENKFGLMKGAMKGDKLAYKITVPDDSTKTWSKGLTSYVSVATGIEEIINMNALIVPENSSSKYVAQDSYLDTVIAEINY